MSRARHDGRSLFNRRGLGTLECTKVLALSPLVPSYNLRVHRGSARLCQVARFDGRSMAAKFWS
jgi:hypothetical protein